MKPEFENADGTPYVKREQPPPRSTRRDRPSLRELTTLRKGDWVRVDASSKAFEISDLFQIDCVVYVQLAELPGVYAASRMTLVDTTQTHKR
jgi:hypothetical protein